MIEVLFEMIFPLTDGPFIAKLLISIVTFTGTIASAQFVNVATIVKNHGRRVLSRT